MPYSNSGMNKSDNTVLKNPQTWVRVKRVELHRLANEIGNEAISILSRWPKSGEGRAIKELTEQISRRLDGQQPGGGFAVALDELQFAARQFEVIGKNEFFIREMANNPLKSRKGDSSPMLDHINTVIIEVRNFATNYPPKPKSEATTTEILEEIIPPQKIGPAHFEIVGGVLRLRHIPATIEQIDEHNADRARKGLIESGDWLLSNFRSSNADVRLIETIEDIQTRLKSNEDIIQLGIASIACQLVFSSYEQEFADVIAARMQAYCITVGMYVGQFPQWIRFSENAAMAEYDPADILTLYSAGQELVSKLRDAGPSVDPEVPRTLSWMLEAIRDPNKAVRRTVFAAIRTIENLVVNVFSAFGDVLNGAVSGTKAGTKLAFQGLVAVGLLTAAAHVATAVSPAAAKVLQTNWMGKAAKIVLEALKKAD